MRDPRARTAKATEARDRALTLIKEKGTWVQYGSMKRLQATIGQLRVTHRTPFQKMSSGSERLRSMRALFGGRAKLPYGLDIWLGNERVLNIEWDEAGGVELLSYRPGEWEASLQVQTI
jgi:hypothetical protein